MASPQAALPRGAERPRREPAHPAAPARIRRALAVALVACSAILAACGSDEASGPAQPESEVTLPLQQTADLREAVRAADCELVHERSPGNDHRPDHDFKPGDYENNPPLGGDHSPVWYDDGVYEPDTTEDLGMLVHTLEHGRINVQYKPGTDDETVAQLEALVAESEGYHMLLYQNTTGMEYEVAATTWGHGVVCPQMNDQVFDAIRTFRTRYIDKGPETVP